MGTNYYLHKDACPHCGRSDEVKHIGKSSAGWCFSLCVDEEIKSLEDWVQAWSVDAHLVKDEYGEEVEKDEMYRRITERGRDSWDVTPNVEAAYLKENNAIRGPNNLLRHSMEPFMFCGIPCDSNCIGHGEGTWDLITGDFS